MTDETEYGNRDIADLLPWYENGRLNESDRQRVDAALATDPALRQELALVREEVAATIDVNEALGTPSRQAVDRFLATLEASPRSTPTSAGTKTDRARFNVIRFVTDRIEALRPQTVAWGAMAALALVVLQGGIISHLASNAHDATTYQSASVPADSVQTGPALLVAFTPTASAGAIEKLLEDNALSVIGGPASGYYSLRIDRHDPNAGKVIDIIARLNDHKDVIRSVMLQSPPD